MKDALRVLADGEAHVLVTVKLDRLNRSVAGLASSALDAEVGSGSASDRV